MQGAGKTSLFKAIMGHGRTTTIANIESLLPEPDVQEALAGGICYSDSVGVNLQVTFLPSIFHFLSQSLRAIFTFPKVHILLPRPIHAIYIYIVFVDDKIVLMHYLYLM